MKTTRDETARPGNDNARASVQQRVSTLAKKVMNPTFAVESGDKSGGLMPNRREYIPQNFPAAHMQSQIRCGEGTDNTVNPQILFIVKALRVSPFDFVD